MKKTTLPVAICTDSLSVHAVLKNDDWRDVQEWVRKIKLISRQTSNVTIIWVPLLCGVDGNEEVDRLADLGTKMDQSQIFVTLTIATEKIRKRK